MNHSELFLQAFSQMLFYEELKIKDVCYFRREDANPHRPDVVMNLGNSMIVAKLEVRGNHIPAQGEDHWIDETYAAGRIEMLETLRQIREGELTGYENHRGEPLVLRKGHISAFPVLILDNGDRDQAYPKLLEEYSPNGVIVNCMMLPAFMRICGTLTAPMEMMHFLYYRACFYGDLKIVTRAFPEAVDEQGHVRPVGDVDLVYRFLADKYSYYKSNVRRFRLESFRDFLRKVPQQTFVGQGGKSADDVIRFLRHFARGESAAFMERIDMLTEETGRSASGLLSTLRPKDDQYAVFFVAKQYFPMEALRQIICRGGRLSNIMEVVGHRGADGEISFEFVLEDHF